MPIDIKLELEDNDILSKFLNEKADTKSKMIYLGYTLYHDCKKMVLGWDKSDFQEQMRVLQDKLTDQSRHLSSLNTRHTEEIANITQEVKVRTQVKYERDLKELEGKCKLLQDELGEVRVSLFKEHQQTMEEKLDNLRTQYEDKLQQERDKCLKFMTVHENSSVKGQHGEEYTYHQLNLLFPKYQIEDTHSNDARGDFLVINDNCIMMVEAKQYQKNVMQLI